MQQNRFVVNSMNLDVRIRLRKVLECIVNIWF